VSQVIREQIFFLVTTLCGGMFLMFGYDLLRLWRWIIPHRTIWFWIEDTLYWSAMSLPVFVVFYRMIDGVLRWYGMVGLLVGGILYECGISIPIRKGLSGIWKRIHKICGSRVAKIIKMLYSKVTGPFG
jgi:hypothetical protein